MSWFSSDPLAVGTQAPDFSLSDESGRVITLSALKGKNVVLVFYPGDDTPGCTRQLCEFRDRWDTLSERGIEVFGVNPQTAAAHARFRAKFQFPFPLLVDKGRQVAKLYQANGLIVKGRYGKTSWVNEKAGILCENYDPTHSSDPVVVQGIVDAVSRLVEDAALRRRLGHAARKDVQEKYNLEQWNAALKSALDKARISNGAAV